MDHRGRLPGFPLKWATSTPERPNLKIACPQFIYLQMFELLLGSLLLPLCRVFKGKSCWPHICRAPIFLHDWWTILYEDHFISVWKETCSSQRNNLLEVVLLRNIPFNFMISENVDVSGGQDTSQNTVWRVYREIGYLWKNIYVSLWCWQSENAEG